MKRLFVFLIGAACAIAPLTLVAQQPPQGPAVVSPDVQGDSRITFRILAPNAQKVELRTPGDIPGIGRGGTPVEFTKNAEGVWEGTTPVVPAGAYRYVFGVDGLAVADSRNTLTSQTNSTVYSLAVVPGNDVFDTKNVPHGALAEVYYNSTSLGGIRRMHVYTPPGYDANSTKYPVFYLLHGAGRRGRLVGHGGPRGFHSRQPDRGGEGQADDRRDAGGARERRGPCAGCAGTGAGARGRAAGPGRSVRAGLS
jgi:enterochelin esterase family protein